MGNEVQDDQLVSIYNIYIIVPIHLSKWLLLITIYNNNDYNFLLAYTN